MDGWRGSRATRNCCNVACGEIEVSVIFINNIFSLNANVWLSLSLSICVCVCGTVSLPLESKNKWQKCQQFCALHCHNDDTERALECFSLWHCVSASSVLVPVCVCVCECCALINTNKYLQFPTPTNMRGTIKVIAQNSMEYFSLFEPLLPLPLPLLPLLLLVVACH